MMKYPSKYDMGMACLGLEEGIKMVLIALVEARSAPLQNKYVSYRGSWGEQRK